MVLRLTVRRS